MAASPSATSTGDGGDGAEVAHLTLLIIGAALAYVGRAIGAKVLSCITNYCCNSCCELDTSDDFLQLLIQGSKNGESGVTTSAIEGFSLTFDQAAKRLRMNRCMSLTVGALRLVFFHWSQPVAYCVALWWYYSKLPQLQLYLGLIVGVREVLYMILTIVCLFQNPAFLLVDSTATYRSSPWNLVLYVVAPEKYVFFCLGASSIIFLGLLVIFDLVGVAALVAAIMSQVMPAPLMVGYSITTLGGFLIIFLVIIPNLNLSCCEPSLAQKVNLVTHGQARFSTLDLSDGTVLPDRGLLGAIKRNTTITELNMKNIDLSDDLLGVLAESLRSNKTLLELEMDYSLMGTEALLTLYSTNHRALPSVLSLRSCGLNVADAFRISKLLVANSTLRVLDLADNRDIGDDGVCALAHAVSASNNDDEALSLTGLDLSGCSISDRGASALYKALADSNIGPLKLSWLLLYDNPEMSKSLHRKLLSARSTLAVGLKRSTEMSNRTESLSTTSSTEERLLPQVRATSSSVHQNDEKRKDRSRHHARILTVSTLELTWEIQLQQLMAMVNATPKELKLMLERDFVYTKISFVGAAKYRKLKRNAHRLLTSFQYLYGSKSKSNKSVARKKSQQLTEFLNMQETERAMFKKLVEALASGNRSKGERKPPSSNFEERVLRACRSSSALLGGDAPSNLYGTAAGSTGAAKTSVEDV